MSDNNTIAAFHIISHNDGILKLNTSKLFYWHIPKELRKEPIQQGDIVLVHAKNTSAPVLVMNVFREELEEVGKKYKKVKCVLERAPQKNEKV